MDRWFGRRAAPVLVVLGLTVGLAGCMTSADAITGRQWKLVEVNGRTAPMAGSLQLEVDGTFSAQPGCNSAAGTYTIDGNRIRFEPGPMTAMACGEPADSQEQSFMAVLGSDPQFQVETQSGDLRLADDAGTLLFAAP